VGFEPTRPFDHRLSRPAPYQARAIPHNFTVFFSKSVSAIEYSGISIKPFWKNADGSN
jgi:hypothetical protein